MKKYKGTFNWHGDVHELWTTARHNAEAMHNFCTQLSGIIGVGVRTIKVHFFNCKVQHHEIKEI